MIRASKVEPAPEMKVIVKKQRLEEAGTGPEEAKRRAPDVTGVPGAVVALGGLSPKRSGSAAPFTLGVIAEFIDVVIGIFELV